MELSKLKPNPNNPRVIKDANFQKLCKSIQEFPKMMSLRPIVVDADNMVLGGNMRLKALQHLKFKQIPDEWVKNAADLTEDEQRRFIIADNISGGEWDWGILQDEWDVVQLEEWGIITPGWEVSADDMGDSFSLPDGDKAPFQQMTFTLADAQAQVIQNAISDIKQTEDYKYAETMGNENSNGNALYLIVSQWAEQRR